MDTPLLTNDVTNKPKVYVTRWYVLTCLSFLTCIQNVIWIGYGPVAQTAKAVFIWSDSTVDMLVNYGNIASIICTFPGAWMLDVKGLRLAVLCSSVMIATGSGIKCISSDPSIATWLIPIGQILNGGAGAVASTGPPLLSETWFPPNERTTATAISIMFSAIGTAVIFVLGPQFISEPNFVNCSGIIDHHACDSTNSTIIVSNISTLRSEIMMLNYIEFGAAALLMILIILHFPKCPPTPPSETARSKRLNFKEGTKKLAGMCKFWHVTLALAIPIGAYGSWGSVLDVNLKPYGISQKEAGWLGFYGSIGGTAFGILISRFSDIFMKRQKQFLIVVFSVATALFVCFAFICTRVIYPNKALLYLTCIAGSTLVSGSMPLFFELACETTYPIAEGVTSGLVVLAMNLVGSMFLLVSLIPNIGNEWPNWTLIGCIAATVPILVLFKADYKRLEIDITIDKEDLN